MHFTTVVTYRAAGWSGQALNFTAGLRSGSAWLTSVYPGAIVSNIRTGPPYAPSPRPRSPPPSPRCGTPGAAMARLAWRPVIFSAAPLYDAQLKCDSRLRAGRTRPRTSSAPRPSRARPPSPSHPLRPSAAPRSRRRPPGATPRRRRLPPNLAPHPRRQAPTPSPCWGGPSVATTKASGQTGRAGWALTRGTPCSNAPLPRPALDDPCQRCMPHCTAVQATCRPSPALEAAAWWTCGVARQMAAGARCLPSSRCTLLLLLLQLRLLLLLQLRLQLRASWVCRWCCRTTGGCSASAN